MLMQWLLNYHLKPTVSGSKEFILYLVLPYLDYVSAKNYFSISTVTHQCFFLSCVEYARYDGCSSSANPFIENCIWPRLRKARYRWHCFEVAFKVVEMKRGYVLGQDTRARLKKACLNEGIWSY